MKFIVDFSFSHRACRPENLRKELDDYNKPIENDRSFDDALNSTESLVRWAHRKAPQYDPENHRPIVRIPYPYVQFSFNMISLVFNLHINFYIIQ